LALSASPLGILKAASPVAAGNDELWLVDARSAPQGHACPQAWHVEYQNAAGCWERMQLGDLFTCCHDGRPLVLFIHGNRNDRYWALRNGRAVQAALLGCNPPAQGVRYVVYSWPAEQIRGPVRDARYKTLVANGEAWRFATLLAQLPASLSVGLVSFSLGGRIAAGALHYLAGGSWLGKSLPSAPRPALRSLTLAPAFDHDWLANCRTFGQALQAVDQFHVFYNSCDPVLKRYDKLDRCGHAAALGYTGLAQSDCSLPQRYGQSDAARIVGKTHELQAYLRHGSVRTKLQQMLLWQPVA
jgi:hypothetical protein